MTAYTLFSGSSGNCIYLQKQNTRILVDVGGSMRHINETLKGLSTSLSEIDAIFITHEHSDHTKALPMLAKHLSIPIYCQREVAKEMYLSLLAKSSAEAAALAKRIRTVEPGDEYAVGSLLITPFKTPHDSVDSQGFVVGDRELGIATDLGHVSQNVRHFLTGCQSVILESNHDLEMLYNGPYPPYLKERVSSGNGHLNNAESAAFSADLLKHGCKNFTLFHLSEENNTPALAKGETLGALTDLGAAENVDFTLNVAARYEVTKVL